MKIGDTPPDFYMSSSESQVLKNARRCWRLKRMANSTRDDLLVIRVAPTIPGGPYGLAEDMTFVIIASRREGDSLFPINTFPAKPLPVYVCQALKDWRERTDLVDETLRNLAWAELYPSEVEARAGMTYVQARRYGKEI